MSKIKIPPPTLNELMVIPKKRSNKSPNSSATNRMIITAMTTILAIFLRSASIAPDVSATKIGTAPSGLTMASRPIRNLVYSVNSSMGVLIEEWLCRAE